MEGYKNKFAGSQADRIIRAESEAENVAEQLKKTEVSGVIFYPFLTKFLSFGWPLTNDAVLSYYFHKNMNLERKKQKRYIKTLIP